MFDVGFQELALIAMIGLIVIGPQRLPKLARTIGVYVSKMRRFVTDVRSDVEQELRTEELKSTFTEASGLSDFDDVKDIVKETQEEMQKVTESFDAARDELNVVEESLDSAPTEPNAGEGTSENSILPTASDDTSTSTAIDEADDGSDATVLNPALASQHEARASD